jgi:hypothetical protein
MEQVLDIYKKPYNKQFPVVCMDESPKQLIKETRVPVAMKPGQETREDFEYERCGVVTIDLASEPLQGKRYLEVTERKTKVDWVNLSKKIADECYKDAGKIITVMDNLATHKPSALYEAYSPKKQSEFGIGLNLFTPQSMVAG